MTQSFFFGETIEDVMTSITDLSCPVCNGEEFDKREKLQHHILKVHFQYSFLLEIHGQTASVLPCRKDCFKRRSGAEAEINRSHFHCPFCEKVFGRSQSFKGHVSGNGKRGKCSASWKENRQTVLDLREDNNRGLPTQVKNLLGLAYASAALGGAAEDGLDLRLDQRTTMHAASEDAASDILATASGESEDESEPPIDEPTEPEPSAPETLPPHLGLPLRGVKRKAEENSCDIQRQILRVLQDILKVEKQRLEIETQKVKLLKMQHLQW